MATGRLGNFDAFPGKHLGKTRLFCLYGENDALIRERLGALRAALEAGTGNKGEIDVLDIEGDDLAREPFLLADEIGSVSLFGGRRLLRVRLGLRATTEAFEHALPLLAGARDVTVAVEGSADKRQDETIRLLAADASCLVVKCEADDRDDLAAHAIASLAEARITMDGDVARDLVDLTDGDRAFLMNEIAKLVLLVPEGTMIDQGMMRGAVADEEGVVLDDAVGRMFGGDVAALIDATDRLVAAGGDPSQLAGAGLRSALWSYKSLAEGRPRDRATGPELRRAIARLADVVRMSRSSDPLAETQAEVAMTRMARHFRR
jgi:DNA polymerase-3 subunit delta